MGRFMKICISSSVKGFTSVQNIFECSVNVQIDQRLSPHSKSLKQQYNDRKKSVQKNMLEVCRNDKKTSLQFSCTIAFIAKCFSHFFS
uniref:Uncharacterized protein n=1 Tax=Aegilops tauschii subsp. strangulata TaxID=200361 RepID=A0A453AL45_AEGTS